MPTLHWIYDNKARQAAQGILHLTFGTTRRC